VKKLAWAVWTYALIYNVYGSWVMTTSLPRVWASLGFPRTFVDARFYALLAGPVITLVAFAIPTRRFKSAGPSN
jgi:hypothetical protein